MLAGLLEQEFQVVPSTQADQLNPVRQILSDLDRAGAD